MSSIIAFMLKVSGENSEPKDFMSTRKRSRKARKSKYKKKRVMKIKKSDAGHDIVSLREVSSKSKKRKAPELQPVNETRAIFYKAMGKLTVVLCCVFISIAALIQITTGVSDTIRKKQLEKIDLSKMPLEKSDEIQKAELKRQELEKKRLRIRNLMEALNKAAEPLVDEKKYREAAAVFSGYNGPLAPDTEWERLKMVISYNGQAEALDIEKKKALIDNIAETIMKGDFANAYKIYSQSEFKSQLEEFETVLKELAAADETIADSFKNDIGKEIIINLLNNKTEFARILRVNAKDVYYKEMKSGKEAKVDIAQLSMEEISKRMVHMNKTAQAIYLGVEAFNRKDCPMAENNLDKAGPLKNILLEKLMPLKKEYRNNLAKAELYKILDKLNIKIPELSYDAFSLETEKKAPAITEATARAVYKVFYKYNEDYANTEFVRENEKIIALLKNKLERKIDYLEYSTSLGGWMTWPIVKKSFELTVDKPLQWEEPRRPKNVYRKYGVINLGLKDNKINIIQEWTIRHTEFSLVFPQWNLLKHGKSDMKLTTEKLLRWVEYRDPCRFRTLALIEKEDKALVVSAEDKILSIYATFDDDTDFTSVKPIAYPRAPFELQLEYPENEEQKYAVAFDFDCRTDELKYFRSSIRAGNVDIDGVICPVGLIDENSNGDYSDLSDTNVVVKCGSTIYKYKADIPLKLNGRFYKVNGIPPTGERVFLSSLYASEVSGKIKNSAGKPIKGARMDLPEYKIYAAADKDGKYSFKLPEGSYKVKVVAGKPYQSFAKTITIIGGSFVLPDIIMSTLDELQKAQSEKTDEVK